ncbi:unnamed protein product [Urochloa humidicola]
MVPRSAVAAAATQRLSCWRTRTAAGGSEETTEDAAKEQEAVLEEIREPQLEMPHEQARAAAVEEKNLHDGIEEESNTREAGEEEQSALDEQAAAAGGLRREAQEEA